MFSEFRVRYPKGSLSAELVTIHEGKYVVRAIVSVENEILATSLGAAKTVELAEDRAISRVMSILKIEAGATTLTPAEAPHQLTTVNPAEQLPTLESVKAPSPSLISPGIVTPQETPQLSFPEPVATTAISPPTSLPVEEEFDSAEEDSFEWEEEPVEVGVEHSSSYDSISPPSDLSEELFSPQFSSSLSTTPSYYPNEEVIQPASAEVSVAKAGKDITPVSPPVDMSDVMARTTVEIKRLGWTDTQGRDYLVKTYKKRSRSLLNDQELLEFLSYLESQPAPNH